ncbi:fibronectin type III domain-containing protein [Cohnella soli]|uniref:Fibronectin type III domain-containing protein n=1 Tax=Cohnella soli TaxID=425005 RepID=A0ABW0HW35_9BACL
MFQKKRKWILLMIFSLIIQGFGGFAWSARTVEAAYDPALQPAVIASGNYHTLFVQTDGTVKSSGYDGGTGALGLGSTTSSYVTPTVINGLTGVKQVTAYGYNSYALLQDGTVKSWGQNANGQLGLGGTSNTYTPTLISGLTNVKQIAAGNGFAIALLTDGTLKGWGTNTYGELLGAGVSTTPVTLSGISSVKQIAVGDKFVLALLTDGTVKSWGYNNLGQLGSGSTVNSSIATTVTGLTNIVQVAAGQSHGLALNKNGGVQSWGYNVFGQLGDGSAMDSRIPVVASSLTNVRSIAAGYHGSMAVLKDDSLKVWGYNGNGQLGTNDVVNKLLPTTVNVDFRIAHGYVGSNGNAFVVSYENKVYGTGQNSNGQLGIGDSSNKSVFTLASTLQTSAYQMDMNLLVDAVSLKVVTNPTSSSSFLIQDGRVWSWGYNVYGQLGLGDTTNRTTPTLVPGLTGVKQLVAGQYHTLALMEDGTVKAWGYNVYGQLGLGDTTNRTTPTLVPGLTGVKQLVAGQYHTLALMEDGTVKAWGFNYYGQLGLGDTTTRTTPTLVSGLTGVKQLVAGHSHTLALMEDGTVKSWGYNYYGQLGLGDTTNRTTPTLISGLTGVKQLVAGQYHTLALMEDGTVKAWGYNSNGQLGLGDTTNRTTPTIVTGLAGVKQLVAGGSHSLALMEEGTVKAWGYNYYGQLGLGDTTNRTTPTPVPGLTGVKQLVAGASHTLALMEDGMVKAWGHNGSGQLGLGDTTNRTTPTLVPGLTGVKQLVAGQYHALALMEDGTAKAWGNNGSGQLGLGDTTSRTTPTLVSGLTGVKQLVAGASHTIALMEDGTAKAWGNNVYGQLGLGDTMDRAAPTLVSGLTGVKQLVAGGSHTLALMEDGTVKAWGYNSNGQLGLGDTTNRTTPTLVSGLTGVKQLVADQYHTLALLEDGTAKAWGYNVYGQLGLGDTTNRTTPTLVSGLAGVKQLVAGQYHTLALMEDGTVKAWGNNLYGRLGLGDTTNRTTPMLVSGLTGVMQLVAGASHTLALMEDGMVKAWGYNSFGQLGLGDTTTRMTPTLVPRLLNVKELVTGYYYSLALMNDGTVKAWGNNDYNQLGFPMHPSTPTQVDQFFYKGIGIQATVNGPVGETLNAKYYLDTEPEPREQQTIKLTDGSAFVKFQSIANASLTKGSHTVRVVMNTMYQSIEKTATFTVQDSAINPDTLEVTPGTTSIQLKGSTPDSSAQLAVSPYQYSLNGQSSGWLVPGTQLSAAVRSPSLDMPGAADNKITLLSNGWWLVAGYSGSSSTGVLFYVSKDQGKTWTQLASLVDASNIQSAPVITANGTKITGLVRYGATTIRAFTFDAVTQSNVNLINQTVNVTTAHTDIPLTKSLAIAADSSGVVHAVWTGKTATYSLSNDLYYAKSTDGGLTWLTVSQLTTDNTAAYQSSNPSLVLVNNQPVIFNEYVDGSAYYVYNRVWNGSSWAAYAPVAVSSYPQLDPSVYAEGSNLYLVWSGTDSGEPSARNIRYLKSTTGGTSWSSAVKLTTGNTYHQDFPVMTSDASNKLFVVYSGIDSAISTTTKNIRVLTSTDGTSWSAPASLTSATTGQMDQPIVLVDKQLKVLNNKPVVLYKDTANNRTSVLGSFESGTSYTATGLTPNTKYTAKFEVKDSSGNVRATTKDVYTLATVPTVALQQVTDQPAKLVITDSNPNETKYQITTGNKYLTAEGQLVNQPVNLILSSKTVSLVKLDRKNTYNFKVRAANEEGVYTAWSTAIRVGPPALPPAMPKNVKAQPTSNSITLSWSPVSEATTYEVEVDNQVVPVAVGRVLSYKHSSLEANTLHQYRVRAVKDGTPGAWSTPIISRTLMLAPVYPNTIVPATTAKTVSVTWNAVTGAVAYEVEWDGQLFTVGKQLTFKQTNLPMGSRHTFRVRAINAGGKSPWSPAQLISTTNTLPDVPVPNEPLVGDKSVSLSWPLVADALTYDIEADGAIVPLNDTTTASFSGLTPGSSHTYRIRAVNELGEGTWSAPVAITTFKLATPAGLVETLSDTSIALQWEAVVNAASYEVEVDGQVTGVSSPTFTKTGLTPESAHTFRIRALGVTGESAWTKPLLFTALPVKPAVPLNVSATASRDQVYLNWSAVNGALGYDVELDGVVIVDNFDGTSYVDTLLNPFTTHQYRIRARTDAIEGDWSAVVTLRTLPDRPTIPSNIAVTSTANIVTLKWDWDPTATKYEVEVDGQVFSTNLKNEYKHRRVELGSEHKYRIRTTNVSGVGDWSGYIINNTLVAKLTKAKTVDMGMVGKDIMDFSRYTLKVTYDPNAIEIVDLSTLTSKKELTTGRIAGTDVVVTSFRPGEAVFTCDKAIALDESWTGVINSIQMKAKVSGGSSITYSVVERPETAIILQP